MASTANQPQEVTYSSLDEILMRGTPLVDTQRHEIIKMVFGLASKRVPQQPKHPASVPPSDGSAPFMGLSVEIRRLIFGLLLPTRGTQYRPLCTSDTTDAKKLRKLRQPHREPVRNMVSQYMTINKQICDEITLLMYEDSEFIIHVHGSIKNGGVELLHVGRQPLQYQDFVDDHRFEKFSADDKFGFQRFKRIVIKIFPSEDQYKHAPINTYLMVLALCRLLTKKQEKHRISSLRITFPVPYSLWSTYYEGGSASTPRAWWDGKKPSATSVHGVPDIELALRPFARLRRCCAVEIDIPPYLESDVNLQQFVHNLKAGMTSKDIPLPGDGDLELKIEMARTAMHDYALNLLYGDGNKTQVPHLKDTEMMEESDPEESDPEESDLEDSDPLDGLRLIFDTFHVTEENEEHNGDRQIRNTLTQNKERFHSLQNYNTLDRVRDNNGSPPYYSALERVRDNNGSAPYDSALERVRDNNGSPPYDSALERVRDNNGSPPYNSGLERVRDNNASPQNYSTLAQLNSNNTSSRLLRMSALFWTPISGPQPVLTEAERRLVMTLKPFSPYPSTDNH